MNKKHLLGGRGFSLMAALTILLGGTLLAENKPHVVFVIGDHEYSSEAVLPVIARELEKNYGMRTTLLFSEPDHKAEKNIPGLEALETADLAVFYLRWRQLPKEQVLHIQNFLEAGKGGIVGFRTTTHAFNYPRGHELEHWNAFGEFALGSPPGWGRAGHTHYGAKSSTDVTIAPENAGHSILKGVDKEFHVRSWLYHVVPQYPPKDATVLLMGEAVNTDHSSPVPNPVAWTWKTKQGARVFTTTLGHPEDFKVESMQRLTINGIHWALGKEVPDRWAGKMNIEVRYGQHGRPAGNQ
jgi:type 1 glutamine amidotransferase